MDNKTHMMFHDEDVREEGRKEGEKAGIALGKKEGLALGEKKGITTGKMETIRGTISLLREAGLPEEQLKSKVQHQFDLTDSQMQKLFK
ncbi:hypothetical protein [Limosilactobacillus kribbianus]|uniref:hypothetical protein n=1 Tax=Limosilactobacillus kribbianus TaxID=2982695 RepID=UPI0022649BBC|nr:hypothetical protein [Limosilactobacillus kribbianus]